MKILNLIFLIVCLNACITIQRSSRKVDDGSTLLSTVEKKYLNEFQLLDYKEVSTPNQFQYIDSKQIQQLAIGKKKLVVFWATWCPVCKKYLEKIATDTLLLRNNDIELILVCQNVNIKEAQSILGKLKLNNLSYIIDPKVYGTDETTKQDLLIKELVKGRKNTEGSVPNSLLLDRNNKVVIEVGGAKVKIDSVIKLFSY